MSSARRLAAIMFTDIVGFTALTQAREGEALALLEVHNQLLRPVFARHQGREIKTIGDAFLVEFDSALDATNCAIDVQRAVAEYDAASPEAKQFQVRVGVHLGDVVHVGADVLGDAINLASRIEPLAEPGGVCVSEQVYAQVRNKVPLAFTKLSPVTLKNVVFPLEVYRIDLPAGPPAPVRPSDLLGAPRRLAVLPLANMSADPQDEFFADGLTEEIISQLSTLPGLRVIARTSVMRYRTTTKGVSEIGKELRVGYVIEGSVRRAGNRIRVTAQLIDTTTEEHLWSAKYDRELVDVFAIQTEIAKEVSVALDITLPAATSVRRRAPPNLEAFKAYLRGRFLWNRRSDESVRAALHSFEEALRLDPQYAEASSGIADCYSILVDRGSIPAVEGGPKAKAAAERAIRLDDSIAEAHASLGLHLDRVYEWAAAEREYKRALELNPMYASAHQWYYMHLMVCGRADEAARELERAEEADPLSPVILFHRACQTWIIGRDEETMPGLERASAIGGELDFTGFYKVVFAAAHGDLVRARELQQRFNAAGHRPYGEMTPVMLLAAVGEREAAFRELEALSASSRIGFLSAFGFAWAYGMLGDTDRFFEWLMKTADEKSRSPFEFVSLPTFRAMRQDRRFVDYLHRCGIPG